MTWLLKLFTGLRGYGVAIGAALLSFVYLYGRKAGQDALRMKQAEKSVKASRKANEIRDKNRTAADDDINKRLSKYSRK